MSTFSIPLRMWGSACPLAGEHFTSTSPGNTNDQTYAMQLQFTSGPAHFDVDPGGATLLLEEILG